MESEVRRLAREQGANAKEEQALVERARLTFRVVDGRVVPLADDGRTMLRAPDGAMMLTVREWIKATTNKHQSTRMNETEMPPRNPFRKKFWNLTEQMRLQKQDPAFAARLKAEAWAEG